MFVLHVCCIVCVRNVAVSLLRVDNREAGESESGCVVVVVVVSVRCWYSVG